jgi:hypothetical protein
VSPLASGPAMTTPLSHLLGGTAGIIATALVAIAALALLITPVFWASKHPVPRPRPGEGTGTGGTGESQPTLLGQARGGHGPQPGVAAPRLDGQYEDLLTHQAGTPHGKPASWVMVAVMLAAFVAGGLALITHLWWLLWTCAGIFVAAGLAAKAAGIMDDTVAYGSNPAAQPEPAQLGTDRVRAEGQPYPGVSREKTP